MLLEAQKIQQIGVPNKNNRIYPRSIIEDIIKQNEGKQLSGTIGMPKIDIARGYPHDLIINVENISHFIKCLRIKDDWLIASIEVFTGFPQGKILKDMLDKGIHIDFRMAGYANVSRLTINEAKQFNISNEETFPELLKVDNFVLCSINAVADGA